MNRDESPTAAKKAEIRHELIQGQSNVLFTGSFTIHDQAPEFPWTHQDLPTANGLVRIDGSGITHWDSSLILSLSRAQEYFRARKETTELVGFPDSIEPLLARANEVREQSEESTPTERESWLIRLGGRGVEVAKRLCDLFVFLGETAQSLVRLVRRKAIFQRSDLLDLLWENTGQSVGIVFLISFLTGLILAFVGAIQLSKFGADLFVADLVSIAMFREMGAMMTGVILAGRTGSAFAAQIGSMKANDELNALQTMGISSFDFIVLPRLVTLSVMMPVLAFLASLSGILGGMLVSVGFMDITATQYLTQTAGSISMASFLSGTGKSIVFGGIIALTGCYRGMAAGSSAESVGQAATSSVVTSIVLVIVADAVFAVLFNIYGI
tara:strand:- start:21724 stop:22872 length:1149 start_codon:yes stop_codon:yes gene_type:complete